MFAKFKNFDLSYSFYRMFVQFDYVSALENCCSKQEPIDLAFDEYKSMRNETKALMQLFYSDTEELSDARAEEIMHIVERTFFTELERDLSERLSNKAIAQVCASMVKYL